MNVQCSIGGVTGTLSALHGTFRLFEGASKGDYCRQKRTDVRLTFCSSACVSQSAETCLPACCYRTMPREVSPFVWTTSSVSNNLSDYNGPIRSANAISQPPAETQRVSKTLNYAYCTIVVFIRMLISTAHNSRFRKSSGLP